MLEKISLRENERELIEIDENKEKEIRDSILHLFISEKSGRQELEERWREYFYSYRMSPSLPVPNLPWQSKNVSPKFFYLVEQFASVVRRSLVQMGKFFSITTNRTDFQELAVALERIASYHLNKSKFLMEFENAIKFGCITGLIALWIDWDIELEETAHRKKFVPKPTIKALNPLDVILDPSGLQRYLIRRYYVPTEYAMRLIEMGIWKSFPLYESPTQESQDEQASKIYYDFSAKRGQVEILEFIGNLISSNSDEIYEGVRVKIANRQYVVQIEKLDYWHRGLPAVWTHLYPPLAGEYSFSLFDSIYPTLQSYNNLLRLTEDSVLLSLGLKFEIDRTRVKEEIIDKIEKEGFSPFVVIVKDGIDEVAKISSLGTFNPNVLPLLQLYNMEIQNATGITEFLMGQPTSKGRPTAREVMIKTQQSGALLDSIAMRIENEIISKIIEKLLILIVQYESIQNLQAILGQNFEVLAPYFQSLETREQLAYLLKDEISIRVDGITQTLHKKEQIEELVSFLSLVSQMPILNELNLRYFIERIAYLFGITSREIFISEEEKQKMIAEQERNIQELAQAIALMLISSEDRDKILTQLIKAEIPPKAILLALQIIAQQTQK